MWLIVCLLLSIVFIVLSTAKYQLPPFLALLLAAFGYGLFTGMPLDRLAAAVNDGFGMTLKSIGIVIIAGTIIGAFLEKTGGAQSLADGALKLTGKKNVPLAMALVGYIVSMPVFCDSGFVILSPLNKALTRKAGISLAAGAIALSLGLYATHTMVPPTPGPVTAAGIMNADLGMVIMIGLAVSFIAMLASWGFAVTVASKVHIEVGEIPETAAEEQEARANPPGFVKASVPIMLPLLLIVIASVCRMAIKVDPAAVPEWLKIVDFLGQPTVALLLGVAAAFFLPRKLSLNMISGKGWVGEAVLASATIIVITGAGGAFGKVLQASGIAGVIGDSLKSTNLGILLPFLIAAAIKTAQGSSTVAMITTAGLMVPLLPSLGLDGNFMRALTVVGIGAGSMVVSHANDSYFWVVTQFSNMSLKQGLKLQTPGTLVEGCVAAAVVWIISLIAA